jgi:CheY-like chemotaxis protein
MKSRLLLVEDNPANLRLLGDWLESEDFGIVAAGNLTEARQSIERDPPEAVLLDIRVGSEDGLDLVRWIRADDRFSRMPVIAVTAHALRHEQEHIISQGCNAIVSKPIDFRLLLRHLDLWLAVAQRQAPQGVHTS